MPQERIALLDAARGVALLGMAAFHLVFDLQMFGMVAQGTVQSGIWPAFARLVAGSFLFLAGVSLWLAHGTGLRWHSFTRRLVVLCLAAGLVSGATYAAMPEVFVYFGILHSIALSSLVGVLVLRLPVFALLAIAAFVVVAPDFLKSEAFNHPALWWTGLATTPRPSVDFEPMLPWLAPFLAGLALAKHIQTGSAGPRTTIPLSGPKWLRWLGRNSLAVYLIHQPILIGFVWSVAQIIKGVTQ